MKMEQHIESAEVIVTYGNDIDPVLLEKATALKWIMVMQAGLERLPSDLIQQKGILLTNVRGIHKTSIGEYVISMLLLVYRQEKIMLQNESQKKWENPLAIQEISRKTILVVGTGSIGQEIARLAKAFQMRTLGVSKSGKDVVHFDETHPITELDGMLPKADFVVSILPSTKETKGIFAAKQFQLMQDHAVFVNVGRGDVLQEAALLKSIQQQEIAHAVLDVFDKEPLPKEHPFWDDKNITITPHLSGASPHYEERALEIFTKNLSVYLDGQGEFLNKIETSRGY